MPEAASAASQLRHFLTDPEVAALLAVLMDFLNEGDTLVVTRIDRLARSLKDLQDIIHELKARGIALRATEQPVDTTTAAVEAFLNMLRVLAEFETNLRRQRQLEGIAAAKALGAALGRGLYGDGPRASRIRTGDGLGEAGARDRGPDA